MVLAVRRRGLFASVKNEAIGFKVKHRIKKILPKTLFARVLLILLVPVVLAQVVAAYIFFNRHWESLNNRLSYTVAGNVSLAVDVLEELPKLGEIETRRRLQQIAGASDLRLELLTDAVLPNKSAQYGMINSAFQQALLLQLGRHPFVIIDRGGERLREVLVATKVGVLRIIVPERRLSSATAYIFLLWMMGSAVLFLFIAILFMRNQIRPILRLAKAAESFGKNQDVVNFKPEGALEVRRAAQAFLLMRERMLRQIRQRTEMLAGVSHDLRTPLTRMKLQLALMSQNHSAIQELTTDVDEMEQMVEGYLAFARGAEGEASVEADLMDIIDDVVQGAKRQHDQNICIHGPDECLLVIRPFAVKRCLMNLISNAIRYAHQVDITVDEAETAVFIYVEDDGPGIPEESRQDVLRPFFRMEESRNLDTGGVGLGLTIASDIAKGHGGDLSLSKSLRLGGLKVTVRLPR